MGRHQKGKFKHVSGRRNGSVWHYVLSALIGAIALGLVGYLFALKEPLVPTDKETLCPLDGPRAITTIVVDRTDSISLTTKSQIESRIHDVLKSLQTGEELSLYEVADASSLILEPTVLICSPQDPAEVDPLTGSVPLAKRKWAEKFLAPVDAVLSKLLSEQEAPVSPIMESVQAISIMRFDSASRRDLPRRMIVITDMLQNSEAISFYRGVPDAEQFLSSKKGLGLKAEFHGAKVELWLIQRNHQAQGDGNGVAAFFARWVQHNKGEIARISRLAGMND